MATLFEAARELGLAVLPYSPLVSGVLSGDHSRDNRTPEGSSRGPLAKVLDASVAATALARVRQQAPVTSTIAGARSVAQLDANPESLHVTIGEDGLRELDRVSAPDLDHPYPWPASIAVPLTQSATRINGIGSATCRREV